MNEVLETIAKRYSCRDFTNVMPEDDKLHAIAKAAVTSPSGMNRQAWRVIVLKDRTLMDEMEAEGMTALAAMEDQTAYQRIQARGGVLYYHAPCMLMLPIDPTQYAGAVLDCGILCQTATLAAASLGIDTLICGFAGLAFSGPKAAYFKEKLGFPAGFEFGTAILLGYAVQPGLPHTPDLDKISFVEAAQ